MTKPPLKRNSLAVAAGGASTMLLDKIDNFDIFRPKLDSTKEVLHAIATFTPDSPLPSPTSMPN